MQKKIQLKHTRNLWVVFLLIILVLNSCTNTSLSDFPTEVPETPNVTSTEIPATPTLTKISPTSTATATSTETPMPIDYEAIANDVISNLPREIVNMKTIQTFANPSENPRWGCIEDNPELTRLAGELYKVSLTGEMDRLKNSTIRPFILSYCITQDNLRSPIVSSARINIENLRKLEESGWMIVINNISIEGYSPRKGEDFIHVQDFYENARWIGEERRIIGVNEHTGFVLGCGQNYSNFIEELKVLSPFELSGGNLIFQKAVKDLILPAGYDILILPPNYSTSYLKHEYRANASSLWNAVQSNACISTYYMENPFSP